MTECIRTQMTDIYLRKHLVLLLAAAVLHGAVKELG